VDAAREAVRIEKVTRELEEAEERQRQWRVVRGTATAEDLRGPVSRRPQARDSWMTDLPAERSAPAQMSQTSVVRLTLFKVSGLGAPGETYWSGF
jgi:hypothetical protein